MSSASRHNFTRKPNLADVTAAGHDMLRLVNRRILLSILSDRQPISRAEIAKISGLKKATISTITGELLKGRLHHRGRVGKNHSDRWQTANAFTAQRESVRAFRR
jgi:predicted transcriptional regulator